MWKIWKIRKQSKLNSEKIGKIWKKGKLKCEKIWKIWKKRELNSEKIWKIRWPRFRSGPLPVKWLPVKLLPVAPPEIWLEPYWYRNRTIILIFAIKRNYDITSKGKRKENGVTSLLYPVIESGDNLRYFTSEVYSWHCSHVQ